MSQRDSNALEISQMGHWYVENLRVTSFPIKPPDEQDDILWWTELFGRQPDVRRNIQQINGKQDEGAFERGKMVLT